MSKQVLSLLAICCPCLFTKHSLNSYEITSKSLDTEHESFMKEPFDEKSEERSQVKNNEQEYYIVPEIVNRVAESYLQHINQSHPYYNILAQKMKLLRGIFDLEVEEQKNVGDTKYGLQVFVQPTLDEKRNIFVYHFTFPTTFEKYEEMQNNFDLQKQFDSNIDNFQCRDRIDDQTRVVYLAYKKIMLVISPRDFVYVRYQFQTESQFWTLATSIPDEEEEKGKIRGSIVLTATRAIEKNGELQLSVYSEVDMKMNMKTSSFKARGVVEIKKYLSKCYDYLEKEREQIL